MDFKRNIAACATALMSAVSAGAFAQSAQEADIYVDRASNSFTISTLISFEQVSPTASIEHRASRTFECNDGTYRDGMRFYQPLKTDAEREDLRRQCIAYHLKPGF